MPSGQDNRFNGFGYSCFDQGDELFFRRHEFLVDADTSVSETSLSGKGHHHREYPVAQFPVHIFVSVLMADNGSGVKAKVGETNPVEIGVEFLDKRFDRF